MSRYQKGKPIWILLKQETVSGSGISLAICKSAPRSRQITTPAPYCSVFYRPDALPVTQPCQSTEGHKSLCVLEFKSCKLRASKVLPHTHGAWHTYLCLILSTTRSLLTSGCRVLSGLMMTDVTPECHLAVDHALLELAAEAQQIPAVGSEREVLVEQVTQCVIDAHVKTCIHTHESVAAGFHRYVQVCLQCTSSFYHATLCWRGIRYGHVSVSVTSRCCTKIAEHRITQTTPHNNPGNLVV